MLYYYLSAVLCSFFYALKGVISKKIYNSTNINEFLIVWTSTLGNVIVFLPFAIIYYKLPTIKFIIPFVFAVILNMIAFTLLLKSIKYTDISITYPLLATTPVYMFITSPIILNEQVSATGGVGVILITIGVYITTLKVQKNKSIISNLIFPFKQLIYDKGALYALIVGFLWSITANLDKYCIKESNPFIYPFLFSLVFIILYFPFVLKKGGFKSLEIKKKYYYIIILGLINPGILLFQFIALQTIKAQYIIAIKRGGMFFSIILGCIFFNEKNMLKKSCGALLIMIGFVMIIFYK